MRKFLLVFAVIAVVIGAFAAWLTFTTPRESRAIQFPLTGRDLALVAKVPRSAEAFAIIPAAAAVEHDLRANPITRGLLDEWEQTQHLPRPWMIGSGDLVIWRSGKQTAIAMDVDPVRATIVRSFAGVTEAPLLINAPPRNPLAPQELSQIQSLAAGLPKGDIFVVQRRSARGAFPPIGRPAVTSIDIEPEDITITSRAAADVPPASAGEIPGPPAKAGATFPASAILSASFTTPPRVVEDLNRLFGARVSSLFKDGGAISIFEVDTGTLLPSPKGVIVLPATDANRDALARLGDVGGLLRSRDAGQELLVSFDAKSIDRYLQETKMPPRWPGARWAIRTDPAQLVPILEKMGDNLGLRIATPRLYRGARDLRRWIGRLSSARVAEAANTVTGRAEELRVRIAQKGSGER